jgi:hypothetical protein
MLFWTSGFLLLNTFLFIKNKRLFISSEVFSALEKNALICYLMAMLPFQSGVTALCNGSLAPFLFEFKLSGSEVTALC